MEKGLPMTPGFHVPAATCQNALYCILRELDKPRDSLNIMFLNVSVGFNETTMVPKHSNLRFQVPSTCSYYLNKSIAFFFFSKSYSTVSTYQSVQARCLIESTPTIILILRCGVLYPLETSLIGEFKQTKSSQKWLSVQIKYFIKNIRIYFANLATEPDSYRFSMSFPLPLHRYAPVPTPEKAWQSTWTYCLDQLSLDWKLQNLSPHPWHTDRNQISTEPGCIRLVSKPEDLAFVQSFVSQQLPLLIPNLAFLMNCILYIAHISGDTEYMPNKAFLDLICIPIVFLLNARGKDAHSPDQTITDLVTGAVPELCAENNTRAWLCTSAWGSLKDTLH